MPLLAQTLSQKIKRLQRLFDLLEQERDALQSLDNAGLVQVTAEKDLCLNQLESLTQALSQTVEQAGFTYDKTGIQAYIQQEAAKLEAQEKENVLTLWQKLQDHLKQCKVLSEANSIVIQVNHAQVSSLLNVIKGREENTYGPQGKREGTESIKGPRSTA